MTIASNTDSKLEGRENRALLWKERNNRIYHHLFSFLYSSFYSCQIFIKNFGVHNFTEDALHKMSTAYYLARSNSYIEIIFYLIFLQCSNLLIIHLKLCFLGSKLLLSLACTGLKLQASPLTSPFSCPNWLMKLVLAAVSLCQCFSFHLWLPIVPHALSN